MFKRSQRVKEPRKRDPFVHSVIKCKQETSLFKKARYLTRSEGMSVHAVSRGGGERTNERTILFDRP